MESVSQDWWLCIAVVQNRSSSLTRTKMFCKKSKKIFKLMDILQSNIKMDSKFVSKKLREFHKTFLVLRMSANVGLALCVKVESNAVLQFVNLIGKDVLWRR